MTPRAVPRRNLYGRHSGRPLRPAQAVALAQVQAKQRFDAQAVTTLHQNGAHIWLEIGIGAGEHLTWQAQANPEVLIIGAEYYLNGFARACKHVADSGLGNVRLHLGDGRDVMDLLPEACLERVFILHPDPWPKARQWRRRLICPQTLNRLQTLLRPGGLLRLASDHSDYQPWILRVLQTHPGFTWTARSVADWTRRPADWPQTRYEAKSVREGRPTMYIEAVRNP